MSPYLGLGSGTAATADRRNRGQPALHRRLSIKLLALTFVFVMVAEVCIFVPSIARFRLDYLNERLADAHLAALAIESAEGTELSEEMSQRLLLAVGAVGIDVRHMGMNVRYGLSMQHPGTRIERWYSLSDTTSTSAIGRLINDAFEVMRFGGGRLIQVLGPSPIDFRRAIQVQIIMDDTQLYREMWDFSRRILVLSIAISVITGILLYMALDRVLVRPMRRLTGAMMSFRDNPEDETRTVAASVRRDEVGLAERELAIMQHSLRAALRQKGRLAALGTGVVKINHDLRNILATASMLSERVADSEDPMAAKVGPRLVRSLDRAVRLCEDTLRYTRDGTIQLEREAVRVSLLLAEVELEVRAVAKAGDWDQVQDLDPDPDLTLDRDQMQRALGNLARNAVEAGATHLRWTGRHGEGGSRYRLEIQDNGPGLPPRALENLFQPFTGSARAGGTGLGLAIAQEILRAHGGDLWLEETGATGTRFALSLPLAAKGHPATDVAIGA